MGLSRPQDRSPLTQTLRRNPRRSPSTSRNCAKFSNVYGRKVAAGEWRDYAMDFGREKAVFSVFRRASECPLYRIEKNPKLARKQGAYSVVAATGLILKRGHDLRACSASSSGRSGSSNSRSGAGSASAVAGGVVSPGPSGSCMMTESSQRPCL